MIAIFCIIIIFIPFGSAESDLPICTKNGNVPQRRVCKITPNYPFIPFILQPILTIQEVLELNDKDRSMTVSIHTLLSWNDTAVKVEGPNPKN